MMRYLKVDVEEFIPAKALLYALRLACDLIDIPD